ncbi:MAG: heavy metal translocating P-type ATPase [Bacillota bacterium]
MGNTATVLEFRLEGLSCADCAAKLERQIAALPGVQEAKLNFTAAKLTVYGDLPEQSVIDEAGRDGVKALPAREYQQPTGSHRLKNRRTIISFSAGILLSLGWGLHYMLDMEAAARAFYLTCIAVGGFAVIRKALLSLTRLRLDMNVLMTLAVTGAIMIGEWSEGATVAFLFSVSEALESYTMDKARNSIRRLMSLAPDAAVVMRGGREIKLPVGDITVGDILVIRPGEKIALDGVILSGASSINQSAITGESVPVDRQAGDEVYAGTLNGEGSLTVQVTKSARDTTLARIIHLVEEAQSQRAPSQTFVERFAAVYTPVVMALALLIAVVPPLFLSQPWEPWIYRGLALLVVSCPCALVVSTPVVIVSAIGGSARHGVLIKGGVHLETLGQLKALAFDKTGTLTTGTPEVTQILSAPEIDQEKLLTLAAAVEYHSEHPLAKAILRKAKVTLENGYFPAAKNFKSFTGLGAKAMVEGREILLGNPRLLEQQGIAVDPWQETICSLQREGNTVVMVALDDSVAGCLALADTVRPQAAGTLAALKKLGISPLVMLTGDHQETARAIALQTGIDSYQANLLPQDKVAAVKVLRTQSGFIGMVGDGVNDAPALAVANTGIAMGGAGSDTALETADVVLMGDDLSKLPFAVRMGRAARQVIKQNIIFSIGIKLLAVLLVFPGWLTLWLAILADMGATLLVTLNGLRLIGVQPAQYLSERAKHRVQI